MLTILRTMPPGSGVTQFWDASITLRDDKSKPVPGKSDIVYKIRTYEKISKEDPNNPNQGNKILLPINKFFETLSFDEQIAIYDLYANAKQLINNLRAENKRETLDHLERRVFDTIRKLDLTARIIEFCKNPIFSYPDLAGIGGDAHHTPEMTYLLPDYIEITGLSLFSKMMVPIWGELIGEFERLKINRHQRWKIAFDLIEPTLEDSAFERIYRKLKYTLTSLINDERKKIDGKGGLSATATSFILTHNAVDDEMFCDTVMATIIVKNMANYECMTPLKDGSPPNAMVAINKSIKYTTNSTISAMRDTINTMPRRELADHDGEDNSSILDHASRPSKKSIDVPVIITTIVERLELGRLIKETDVPMDVYNSAADYYDHNGFDISPICQAMVASFIGTRFDGSKTLNYLPPSLYFRIVIILQVFLIRQGFYDLAALASSKTLPLPLDGPITPIAGRIHSTKISNEYRLLMDNFKGYVERPVVTLGRRIKQRKAVPDKINFENHIERMIEWLTRSSHSENMAPVLWDFSKLENRPLVGSDVQFDESVIRNLCRFYLIFHGNARPF